MSAIETIDPQISHDAEVWFDTPIAVRDRAGRARRSRHAGQSSLRLNHPQPADAPKEQARHHTRYQLLAVCVFSLIAYYLIGFFGVNHQLSSLVARYDLSRDQTIWRHGATSAITQLGAGRAPLYPLLLLLLIATHLNGSLLPIFPAVAAAGAMTVLWSILTGFRLSGPERLLPFLLIATNPVWLFLIIRSSPDLLALVAVFFACYGLVAWLQYESLPWVIVSSIALVFGVMASYLVVIWAIAAVVAITVGLVLRRAALSEIRGRLLMFAAPIFYISGIWVVIIWRTHNSLHFANSSQRLLAMPLGIALILLAPILVAVAISLRHYYPRRSRSTSWALMLVAIGPLPVLAAVELLWPGASAGAMTPFFLLLPFVAIFTLGAVWFFIPTERRWKLGALVTGLLLISNIATAVWMTHSHQPQVRAVIAAFSQSPARTPSTSSPALIVELGHIRLDLNRAHQLTKQPANLISASHSQRPARLDRFHRRP